MKERGGVRCARWDPWDLLIDEAVLAGPRADCNMAIAYHHMVADWLETHPEDAVKYLAKKRGFQYYNILDKAKTALAAQAGGGE